MTSKKLQQLAFHVQAAGFDALGRELRRWRRQRVWRARMYLLRKRARRFLP